MPKYEQHHENRAICLAYILQSSQKQQQHQESKISPSPIPKRRQRGTSLLCLRWHREECKGAWRRGGGVATFGLHKAKHNEVICPEAAARNQRTHILFGNCNRLSHKSFATRMKLGINLLHFAQATGSIAAWLNECGSNGGRGGTALQANCGS